MSYLSNTVTFKKHLGNTFLYIFIRARARIKIFIKSPLLNHRLLNRQNIS